MTSPTVDIGLNGLVLLPMRSIHYKINANLDMDLTPKAACSRSLIRIIVALFQSNLLIILLFPISYRAYQYQILFPAS